MIWTDIAARPELRDEARSLIGRAWPDFVIQSRQPEDQPPAEWSRLYDRWPALQLLLLEGERLVAVANNVPLAFAGPLSDLPDEGWDWAMVQAREDAAAGRAPTLLCGISVTIDPERRGRGLSHAALAAMSDRARAAGLRGLVVPVRPTSKDRYPLVPMGDYAGWNDARGLPMDPWLRAHARVGGELLHPCERAMRLEGSVAEWERWLGMALPQTGRYTAPGLLAPLEVDREADIGRYTEPNLWVSHRCSAAGLP